MKIADLKSEIGSWSSAWVADIDDPNTPDEAWTGKWRSVTPDGEDSEVEVGGDYSADLGRYLAKIHNSAPALITAIEAAQNLSAARTDAEVVVKLQLLREALAAIEAIP